MKIRSGFVSNSSSSSFIVATKPGSHKVTLTIDLCDDLGARPLTTKDEVLDYILDRAECESIDKLKEYSPELHKDYLCMCKRLEEGMEILVGEVSSESENALEQEFYNQGIPLNKDMEQLE